MCLFDGGFEFIGQLALLLDFAEDFFLPFDEIAQIGQAFFERAQLLILQSTRGLFAVAGNKRYGIAAVQQLDGGRGLLRCHAKFLGDKYGNIIYLHGGHQLSFY